MPKTNEIKETVTLFNGEEKEYTSEEINFAHLIARKEKVKVAYKQAISPNVKDNTARKGGCLLRNREDIQLLIHTKKIEITKNMKLETSQVVNKIEEMVTFDVDEALDENGNLLPLSEMPLIALNYLDITYSKNKDGVLEVEKIEINAKLKLKALQLLAKIHGLDKSDTTDESLTDVFNLDEC